MTPAALQSWRDTASAGDRQIYYTGFLGRDGEYVLKEIAGAAYVSGWFDLSQRRIGVDRYEYIIRRRQYRDPVPRFWRPETAKGGRVSETHWSQRVGELRG